MEIKPIAYIKTDFNSKFGIPRQSGLVKELTGEIVFEKEFRDPDFFRGIEEFSHLWLIFSFSKNIQKSFSSTVRPPRLGGNRRVGVFSTRSPFRPNGLGLSCVKLEKVKIDKTDGVVLCVSGVDLLNNTPVFDIKPYIPYCDCIKNAAGSFAEENKNHRLSVSYNESVFNNVPENKIKAIIKCIEQDPRPSYQNDDRIYKMNFSGYEIGFKIKENTAFIVSVE